MTIPPGAHGPDTPRTGGSPRRAAAPSAAGLLCGALALTGCALGGPDAPAPPLGGSPSAASIASGLDRADAITFVDLDAFDRRLAAALNGGAPAIDVAFVGSGATVHEMPPRLRRWLDAVARSGNGLTIGYADGLERKNVALVAALASGGYRMFVDARRRRTVRDYRAELVVEPDDASIRTIRFLR